MVYQGYSRVIFSKTLPNGDVEVKEKIVYSPDRDTKITIQNTGERYLTDDEIIKILNEEEIKKIIETDKYPLKDIRSKVLTE